MVISFPVFPSQKVSDKVAEAYNVVLSLHHLIESIEQAMVIDNESIYDFLFKN